MPIDETKQASDLLAKPEELSFIELQNRQGMRHEAIRDLPAGYITILAVATEGPFETERYSALLDDMKTRYGVRGMQTMFGCSIPEEHDAYRYDLHLTAHLRIDPRPAADRDI